MKQTRIIIAILISIATLASCDPNVELCKEETHPHLGSISYQYDWTNDIHTPDSMYIIANRVINIWKSSMVVNAHTGVGKYLYNAPKETQSANDVTEVSQEKDNAIEDSVGSSSTVKVIENKDIHNFKIKTGWYKFFTFNMDTTELVYNDVIKYMTQETPGINLRDLNIEYRTYIKNDAHLHKIIDNWQDYNPYSEFIQPNMNPIYFDTIASCKISNNNDNETIKFKPQQLTQNIDIYFNIKKNVKTIPFIIDSIRAEISGIPHSVNLSNGFVDIQKTNKMMFSVDIVDASNNKVADTYNTTAIHCHSNIDVLTLVSNSKSDVSTGPGIMQIIMYTHAIDSTYSESNNIVYKRMQGKINLFNTLNKANLLKYTDDGKNAIRSKSHGIININTDVTIDGSHIIESPDNDGGLDKWKDCGEVIIDI